MSFTPLFGYLPPPTPRFAAVPAWSDANPVLPESEWREHDEHAHAWPEIEAQENNNCTMASLASLARCAFRIAGVDAPRFSWSANYARHNGGQDAGAYCRDLMRDFKEGPGLCPAALCPDRNIFARWSQEMTKAAGEWIALEVYQVMSFEEAASALSRGFLVYHGFVLGNGFTSVPASGKVPEFDGRFANGHAMASRGLTKRFGDWRTVTPNSWGTGWGDKGVGYWPKSYWWLQSGSMVNLEAFAVRAVKHQKAMPVAA